MFIHNLASFKYKKCWDRTNSKFSSRLRIFVNIKLTDYGLAFIITGQFFYYRSDHFARATPFSPKIH